MNIPVITPLWNATIAPIWHVLVTLIFNVLGFFYVHLWGSAGLAIIALTILVRIILIPLTYKQVKSMVEMQRLQPKIKELQTKYKNDPEKQQAETMKFYQENKVNPLGGCLPLLIQMPVFIALYQVLSAVGQPDKLAKMGLPLTGPVATNLNPSFFFIVPNLAKTPQQIWAMATAHGIVPMSFVLMIPYVALILLFSLSIYIPQRMTTTDPSQQRIGLIMAVMFLWFGWLAPAGVLLYWVVSSTWQVVQQWITMRMMNRTEGAEAK